MLSGNIAQTSTASVACIAAEGCGHRHVGSRFVVLTLNASCSTVRSARMSVVGVSSRANVPNVVTTLPDDVITGGNTPRLATAEDSKLDRQRAFATINELHTQTIYISVNRSEVMQTTLVAAVLRVLQHQLCVRQEGSCGGKGRTETISETETMIWVKCVAY